MKLEHKTAFITGGNSGIGLATARLFGERTGPGTASPGTIASAEARISKAVPLGRLSDADEIAKAVLFLASSDASNITASEIVVDGGHTGAPAGAPVYRA